MFSFVIYNKKIDIKSFYKKSQKNVDK